MSFTLSSTLSRNGPNRTRWRTKQKTNWPSLMHPCPNSELVAGRTPGQTPFSLINLITTIGPARPERVEHVPQAWRHRLLLRAARRLRLLN
jgi:hypothetical protein